MDVVMIITILLFLACVIGLGLVFKKAGYNFWLVFVPIYNLVIWTKIIGKPNRKDARRVMDGRKNEQD